MDGSHLVLSLPGGFILCVVLPLKFHKADCLVSGLALILIKNTQRDLLVGQIFGNGEHFNLWDHFGRGSKTLLQL